MRSTVNFFQNLLAIFAIIVKRLRYHLGLSISSGVGIISVLSLVICVPIFTNAVMSQVLKQELIEKAAQNHRSLFSIHAYYRDDTTYTPFTLKSAHYISRWMDQQLSGSMGLKVDAIWMEMSTESFSWEPIKYQSSQAPFADIGMNIMGSNQVPEKTRLVEGVWPVVPSAPDSGEPLQVAVYEGFADEYYLNVGDILHSRYLDAEIVGVFRAIDASDLSWFYSPETTFRKTFWVSLDAFESYLPALIERPAYYNAWYAIASDQSLRFANSMNYSRAMTRFDSGLHALLKVIKIDYSPADCLQIYEDRLQSLTTLFYVAGAPLVLLALIFISLTASIAVQQEEQEIATMRGRGVSWAHIYSLNLVESFILIGVTIPFSLLLGWSLSNLMGKTRLFLQFTRQANLTFLLQDANLVWIALICILIIASRLSPLLGLRRTTTVTIKQERSRGQKKPFWERYFIDFMLLVPSLYAFWLLKSQAKPIKVLTDLKLSGSSGQYDPLMFLASSMFAVAACMILLRFFPLFMRLLGLISNRFTRTGPYLAIQEIYRQAHAHASVMLLIMISLCLAIFSASTAKTLDQWMHDSLYYQAGTDLVVKEYEIPLDSNPMQGEATPAPTTSSNVMQGVESLISLEKHLTLPGIQSATTVGKYSARILYGSQITDCVLMGIDRLSFPMTAFYRKDFSSQSLGALLNLLAVKPYGLLAPQSLLDETGLRIGDNIMVTSTADALSGGLNYQMEIVGAYDYFPTVYPEDALTLIANLAALFGSQEAATGYDVWINLKEKTGSQAVLEQLTSLALKDQLLVDVLSNVPDLIQEQLNRPEWVGLFGILSVGFLLTGLMACIGFVLETVASLRRQYIQFGILQAIGLSSRQLVSYLVLERFLLMLIALSCGTAVGYLTSIMFVPLLQISTAPGTPVPPFEVMIAWSQSSWLILIFGLVLLTAIVTTISYLMQIKIFQAVKMGESI